MRNLGLMVCIAMVFAVVGYSQASAQVTELKRFPLDNLEGIITLSGVQIDKQTSSDGNGSLRITATKLTVVRLFEVGDIDIENARLIYQARVRTEDVKGQVYLEMWCHFPGAGEFFSRGLTTPLTGTTNWTTEETPFFLKKGQNPDNVKLNLVINGKGTAWIDDIRLLKGPLAWTEDISSGQALLDKGTDVKAEYSNAKTALMDAAKQGHTAIVRALLDRGIDVNAKDKGGGTALMLAATEGHTATAQALLDSGADINEQDKNGNTALMYAAGSGYGSTPIVQTLLLNGADVNAKNKKGNTALMETAKHGDAYAVQALLDKGADVNAKDDDGVTALMMAAEKRHTKIVRLLKQAGARE